jgi:two-component system, LytTR family, sensor kinase
MNICRDLMRRRLRYYILFTTGFSLCWFLSKLGWMHRTGLAFGSASFEIFLNIAALVCMVEWLLPRFFYRSEYWRFGLGLGLLVLVGGSANIFFQLHLVMGSNPWEYHANIAKYKEVFYYWFWSNIVADSYLMIFFVSLGGFAARLAFDRALTARRMARLEAENLRSEVETLKNQINPHFIFNALNTIYYKIDRANGAARMLTEQFSALLRYQLYECNEAGVEIEKEIRFIENYVGLQRERSGEQVRVSCSGFGSMTGFTIPPHVLAPLVENCFKHVSLFKDRENFIALTCSLEKGRFHFRTLNTYDPAKKSESSGIGLANTRKRLELLCRDRFTLSTAENGNHFETTLILEI